MAIRIVTDSTSDISVHTAQSDKIQVVPLKVIFGKEEYRDGLDLSMDEFYKRLVSSKDLPTTSQPTPNDFITVFEEAKEAGDEVIAILISSELSGTYQSAQLAKNFVEYEHIHIIDSYQVATSLQLLVKVAVNLVNQGKRVDEIVDTIEYLKTKVVIKAIVDTLDYLVKGGRLSKAAGFAGSLLAIKPLISIIDGKVSVIGKARGKKGAFEALWRDIEKDYPIDFNYPMSLAYTHEEEFADDLNTFLKTKEIQIDTMTPIGTCIGCHVGPGACAIAYFKK